ncbi:MAG: prolipoprotein diacylglyceryl transferase [Pseudomonadota bacterium]
MIAYPHIDPVIVQLGPLAIHWYGLMYLFSFVACWVLLTWRVKHSDRGFSAEQMSDILFYGALGIILGGRLGYVIFYAWSDFIANPLILFKIWNGGMSFHGGFLGVLVAMGLYARKIGKNFVDIMDLVAPVAPIGLGAGRIGNFINGELWGKVTNVPWGMVFPHAGSAPRHPSQLYEFFLEGVVMFVVLWLYSMKPRPRWAVSGLFLILYGAFRLLVEFVREPDAQIGYLAFGWLTEGQVLSLPMLIFGVIMMFYAYRSKTQCSNI